MAAQIVAFFTVHDQHNQTYILLIHNCCNDIAWLMFNNVHEHESDEMKHCNCEDYFLVSCCMKAANSSAYAGCHRESGGLS